MAAWALLEHELDAWSRLGETATLWWRDDDAIAATPALDRLIELAGEVPLALAVIPAGADATLVRRLDVATHVAILQHGYRHANNSSDRVKKAEFPPGRDVDTGIGELRLGRRRLTELFDERALPALVPPWNRIDARLVDRLPDVGLWGLSAFGPRESMTAAGHVRIVNTHVDIINWRGDRRFLGADASLALMVRHLGARRERQADRAEPTGLLTHHLVHDEDAWAFVATLLRLARRHPAVRWLDGRELFAAPENAAG
jgi:hypothetical protein